MFMRCSVCFLSLSLTAFGPSFAHSILQPYILCTATFHRMIFSLLFPSHVFCICLCHFRSVLILSLYTLCAPFLFLLRFSCTRFSSLFLSISFIHSLTHAQSFIPSFLLAIAVNTSSCLSYKCVYCTYIYTCISHIFASLLSCLFLDLPMNVYQVCTNAFQIE